MGSSPEVNEIVDAAKIVTSLLPHGYYSLDDEVLDTINAGNDPGMDAPFVSGQWRRCEVTDKATGNPIVGIELLLNQCHRQLGHTCLSHFFHVMCTTEIGDLLDIRIELESKTAYKVLHDTATPSDAPLDTSAKASALAALTAIADSCFFE